MLTHQDPVAQDCKIPFLKVKIQPNLEPEKYQRENDYVKDLVARRHHQVSSKACQHLVKHVRS